MSPEVHIYEVGARDGLQNEAEVIPTAAKLELLGRMADAGLRMAVVSNSDGSCESSLVARGLRDHFHAVMDSHLVGHEKPDPRIFLQALERVGASPSESVYVGDDHENDVRAARAAGLRAVDVTTLATLLDLPAHLEAVAREPRT